MFVKKRNLIAYTHENEEAILLDRFLLLFLTAWLALDKESTEKVDSSPSERLRWTHNPSHTPPPQAGAGVPALSTCP